MVHSKFELRRKFSPNFFQIRIKPNKFNGWNNFPVQRELTKITLLIPTLLQISNCLYTPNASTFAGPVKSNEALAPVAITNASIPFKALSSSSFLSNEILIVSKRSSPADTFEFFLMICLTLYPFLTASSEIL